MQMWTWPGKDEGTIRDIFFGVTVVILVQNEFNKRIVLRIHYAVRLATDSKMGPRNGGVPTPTISSFDFYGEVKASYD